MDRQSVLFAFFLIGWLFLCFIVVFICPLCFVSYGLHNFGVIVIFCDFLLLCFNCLCLIVFVCFAVLNSTIVFARVLVFFACCLLLCFTTASWFIVILGLFSMFPLIAKPSGNKNKNPNSNIVAFVTGVTTKPKVHSGQKLPSSRKARVCILLLLSKQDGFHACLCSEAPKILHCELTLHIMESGCLRMLQFIIWSCIWNCLVDLIDSDSDLIVVCTLALRFHCARAMAPTSDPHLTGPNRATKVWRLLRAWFASFSPWHRDVVGCCGVAARRRKMFSCEFIQAGIRSWAWFWQETLMKSDSMWQFLLCQLETAANTASWVSEGKAATNVLTSLTRIRIRLAVAIPTMLRQIPLRVRQSNTKMMENNLGTDGTGSRRITAVALSLSFTPQVSWSHNYPPKTHS